MESKATVKLDGFDKHVIRYFDMSECKYEGDGAEKLITSYESYNPVVPQVGTIVWEDTLRYIVISIDYIPGGNLDENDHSVMVDISLVEAPLAEVPAEYDEYCSCCSDFELGSDHDIFNISNVNIYS